MLIFGCLLVIAHCGLIASNNGWDGNWGGGWGGWGSGGWGKGGWAQPAAAVWAKPATTWVQPAAAVWTKPVVATVVKGIDNIYSGSNLYDWKYTEFVVRDNVL